MNDIDKLIADILATIDRDTKNKQCANINKYKKILSKLRQLKREQHEQD